MDLAQDAGDLQTEMTARRAVAWALTATGEREQACSHADVALAHAEKLRERWWIASTSFTGGVLALYEGDWQAARELGDLGLSAQPLDPRHFGVRLVLEYSLGDYGEGRAYIERQQEVARSSAPPGPLADHVLVASLIPLASRIACSDEGLDAAEASAKGVLSVADRSRPGHGHERREGPDRTSGVTPRRLRVSTRSSSRREAPGSLSSHWPSTGCSGFSPRPCGRIDAALSHFGDGLAFCRRAGYRPEYAWTASDYAEVLLRRAGADDRARAVALRDESLVVARELGMQPLIDRVRASADA